MLDNKIKYLIFIVGMFMSHALIGQYVLNSYAFESAAPPVSGLLLDDYPNAAAAYSLRKLRTGYIGDCIEVRRVSDGTLSNIGFSGNYLDTVTLKTFCAGTDCFVRTWYDQSGNTLHTLQTNIARQPRIITNGNLTVSESGDVAMFFNGGQNLVVPNSTASFNYLHNGTNSYLAFVGQAGIVTNPVAAYYFIDNNNGGQGVPGYYCAYFDSGTNNNAIYTLGHSGSGTNGFLNIQQNAFIPNKLLLYDEIIDADASPASARSNIKFDAGTSIANNTWTGTTGLNVNAFYNMTFGSYATNAGFLTGYISEILFYSSDQTINRTGIQSNINSFYKIYWDGSQQGLLDQYPGAAAAYSLRALNSAYTGALIRVRRANDSAESDIFATYSGYLDTVALKNFCAGTDCFVRTWYDQSTNTRNATQTTAAQQPQIISGGNLYYVNGKPSINANTSFRRLLTAANISFTAYYASIVSNVTGQFSIYAHLIGFGTTPFNQFYRTTGDWRYFSGSDFATNVTFASGQRLLSFADDNTNTIIYLNGVSNTTIAATPDFTNQDMRLFGYTNQGMAGDIQEVIFYTSDQTSNRTGIESNINSFYNIY